MSNCEDEETYFISDIGNDQGFLGCIGMSKELYDEDDLLELTYMIARIIDTWLKRRAFMHQNIDLYHKLC